MVTAVSKSTQTIQPNENEQLHKRPTSIGPSNIHSKTKVLFLYRLLSYSGKQDTAIFYFIEVSISMRLYRQSQLHACQVLAGERRNLP